jgi:hypothetical protein
MSFRKLSAAVVAALVPLSLAGPVAGASAAQNNLIVTTAPMPALAPGTMTFIPPRVAPIMVILGPTIIDGQQISPGVNVSTPGVSLPPMSWTLPF